MPVVEKHSDISKIPENSLLRARKVLVAFYFVSALIYFQWRLTTFNSSYPIYSFLFYVAELVGFIWQVLNLSSLLYFKSRPSMCAPLGKTVDVFIPTYNEPVAIVRRTVMAAMQISYPHETWLLDDGNRPEMLALAEELGCRYIARIQNKGAKAGNLNNALLRTEGEFIAILDADFIAAPEFLDKTLGFFGDQKVAFVQTPQEFYNFDSYQHIGRHRDRNLWSEHSLFFHAQQRGRDTHNAAMFCGSSAVLRRSALEAVGGFASTTVTEDMHTSVLLHSHGWSSVYYPEILSAGLAPHDAKSFQRQRTRWAEGAMQIARQEGLFARRMNFSIYQQMAYINHVGNYIEGPRHIFLYIASAVTLVFYISPLKVSFFQWAIFYLPFLFLGLLAYKELSRGYAKVIKNEIFNMARCPALVRAFPALFSKKHIEFKITPKVKTKPSPFVFPWAVLMMNLLALAKATYDEFLGIPRIDGWPIMIVVMWCSLGLWLAWSVCCLTRRCNNNRRSFSRFPAEIGIKLTSGDSQFEATATQVSDGGLTVKPKEFDGLLPSGTCRGVIDLCGRGIPFNILLRPTKRGHQSGGVFLWDNLKTRDEYEYFMMIERIRKLEGLRYPDNKTYIGFLARLIDHFVALPA